MDIGNRQSRLSVPYLWTLGPPKAMATILWKPPNPSMVQDHAGVLFDVLAVRNPPK